MNADGGPNGGVARPIGARDLLRMRDYRTL
jgi:hypothetical protein